MFNVVEQPGLLFVIATLLPLASFVLLLLLGGLRWALRPHATPGSGTESLFLALGGAVPGRGPAFVALAAIGLAFLCSVTGFGIYLSEHEKNEEVIQGFEKDEAGKTGTSQMPENGQYSTDHVWASYAGFLPADNPKFTMLVVVRKPNNGSFDHNEGYYVSAPIWKAIAQAIILQWRITPDPR